MSTLRPVPTCWHHALVDGRLASLGDPGRRASEPRQRRYRLWNCGVGPTNQREHSGGAAQNGGRRCVISRARSASWWPLVTGVSHPADDADALRLAALNHYAILDTAAEPGFDDIVELAIQICDAPIALVSLVDKDRQWFKARAGFAPCQTSLDQSICVHALAVDDLLIIPDLTQDPRTRDNTLVTGRDHLRFYAGAVLKTPQGVPFGSLCVMDVAPRSGGLTRSATGGVEGSRQASRDTARTATGCRGARRSAGRAKTGRNTAASRYRSSRGDDRALCQDRRGRRRPVGDPRCRGRGCLARHPRRPGVCRGAAPRRRTRHQRGGGRLGAADWASSADARQPLGQQPS